MEWITRELTSIDKVRRNVVLLATLSALVCFFPVRTDEVSLIGAKFSSDVVYFGLFHGTAFYTMVLLSRIFIHLMVVDIEKFKSIFKSGMTDAPDGEALKRMLQEDGSIRFIEIYVLLGEYLFPLIAGVWASYLLYHAQEFPMLWELHAMSARS